MITAEGVRPGTGRGRCPGVAEHTNPVQQEAATGASSGVLGPSVLGPTDLGSWGLGCTVLGTRTGLLCPSVRGPRIGQCCTGLCSPSVLGSAVLGSWDLGSAALGLMYWALLLYRTGLYRPG